MGRILVVDDDADILNFCQTKLAALGHSVDTAGNADDAIAAIGKGSYDLLILDINMPGRNGFELLRALKSLPVRGFKILMLTSRRTSEDVLTAFSLGAIDYVCKPIQAEVLFPKVQGLLGASTGGTEVEFFRGTPEAEGIVSSRSSISRLSDRRVVMLLDIYLEAGTIVKLDADLFEIIGVPAPKLRVTDCQLSGDGSGFKFVVSAAFIDVEDESMTKIRAWISRNARAGRKSA